MYTKAKTEKQLFTAPLWMVVLGVIFLGSGYYLLAGANRHDAEASKALIKYAAAIKDYEKKNYFYSPDTIVRSLRSLQVPEGYFVSDQDLLDEPKERNAKTISDTMYAVNVLYDLGALDTIDRSAAVDYIMSVYTVAIRLGTSGGRTGFAGFRSMPFEPPGLTTTLHALEALNWLGALENPGLDLEKIYDFIMAHRNPDGGFWDEDHSEEGRNSSLTSTSFAIKALGIINKQIGRDFDKQMIEETAGFVRSTYDPESGRFAESAGRKSSDAYNAYKAYFTLWWLGGEGGRGTREYITGNIDFNAAADHLIKEHYNPDTGFFFRYEGAHDYEESLMATRLSVQFLAGIGLLDRLDRDKIIKNAVEFVNNRFHSNVQFTHAAVSILKLFEAPTEPIAPPTWPLIKSLDYPKALPTIFITIGLLSIVASYIFRKKSIEMRESEKKYRTLVETANDAIFVAEADSGVIIDANRKASELLGLPVEKIIGMHFTDLHPEEEADEHRERFRENLKQAGHLVKTSIVVKRSDGTLVPVEISTNLTEIGGKRITQGIFRDISDRISIEESLRRSEKRLLEAQRIAKLGFWEWDIKTNELYWSDQTFTILGHVPQSFVPRYEDFLSTLPEGDREAVLALIDRTLKGKAPYRIDHRIVRADGEVRYAHSQGEVTYDADGIPVKMMGTISDITERKEAEEALRLKEESYRTLVESSPN